jgi:hypothetical protein
MILWLEDDLTEYERPEKYVCAVDSAVLSQPNLI